jgi:hypothetical protein
MKAWGNYSEAVQLEFVLPDACSVTSRVSIVLPQYKNDSVRTEKGAEQMRGWRNNRTRTMAKGLLWK